MGFEGILDPIQRTPSTATFFPLVKSASKFTADLSLPEEYQIFFDHFDSVVLIAFGTTWLPSMELMMTFVETIKLVNEGSEKIGFIISLKTTHEAYADIEKAAIPNVLLSKWVP